MVMTKAIDVDKTELTLRALIELVEEEDTQVILMREGIPVAIISPIEHDMELDDDRPRIAGLHTGTTWISDDFDEPLPDEFWLGKE